MNFIEQISDYLRQYPDLIEASGKPSGDQLSLVSEHFGGSVPDALRHYLAAFGSLNIPPDEFAGLSPADPEGTFHNHLIGMHQRLVHDLQMPNEYIPLLSEDGDSFLVLIPQRSSEAVFRWYPQSGQAEPAYDSLASLLLRRCEELIEDETEVWTGWEARIAACRWFTKVGKGKIERADRVDSWERVAELLAGSDYQEAKKYSAEEFARTLRQAGIQAAWQASYEAQQRNIDRLLNQSIVPAVEKKGLPEVIVDSFREHALRLLVSFPYFGPDYDALDRRIVELYLAGYCPCGYQGRYPRGKVSVY